MCLVQRKVSGLSIDNYHTQYGCSHVSSLLESDRLEFNVEYDSNFDEEKDQADASWEEPWEIDVEPGNWKSLQLTRDWRIH